MITEIKEKDFRKLNLLVWKWKPTIRNYERVHINDILDEHIKLCLEGGNEEDVLFLNTPVTIAVHKDNDKKSWSSGGYYLDKFMNSYTGAATYQLGLGIDHLYSTRDYYECRSDYWRVPKKETDVVYRVHLDPRPILLKHKTVISDVSPDGHTWTETKYNFNEETETWEEHLKFKVEKEGQCTEYIPHCKISEEKLK